MNRAKIDKICGDHGGAVAYDPTTELERRDETGIRVDNLRDCAFQIPAPPPHAEIRRR
jgi:hypothetical protein